MPIKKPINEGLQLKLNMYKFVAGDFSKGVIPDPIPNSEVKPLAPMVLCLKTRKSRSLPALKL